MKRYLILFAFVALQQANILASATNYSSIESTSYQASQQADIYSDQYIINRAGKLFYCIPDHAQVSPNAKPYMTSDLYNTLKKAWDVPHWCYGYIGDEEFLYYFVTGNGGGSIGSNSAISGAIQSKSEKTCQVRINYKEYEQGYGYYNEVRSIEILMYLQNGDWVMADFGLGTLDECKKYINKQVNDYKSGEIAKQMKSLDLSQSDINKASRAFDDFLSVYGSNGSGELSTIPYVDTTTPPTFKGEGLDSFVRWILSRVKYPEYCIESHIEGDLKICFIVDENGFIIDEKVVKSVEPSLDDEVMRYVSASPQWNPGNEYGNTVKTFVELTIPLRINGSDIPSSPSSTSTTSAVSRPSTTTTFSTNTSSQKGEETEEESIPFQLVEVKPSFNGGDANEFSKWVNSHLVYPDIAKENGVMGRVMIQFTVKADGQLANIKVLRGVDPSLDKEAVRVVSMSPKWKPGQQRGKNVNVTYTFPVIFQLR